ncbi:unnamed protein product [Rotaria sordida]|uniref:CCDC92/74 N-terminal domain-containing protein n=1 Tax=Rotaria sordida TaxID=392033 RepID=A0A813U582_9BILA|nr:unnamed protein product [Rotaria sordida]CAF1150429.1 unnamed protein product [Rotaria sordida]
MIRQSIVDERVSALHSHTLQSPGDSDGDMSKPTSRRIPAPVASRIIIRKNSSLLPTNDEIRIISPSTTPSPTPTVDPRSRVELLERNLRYVQQQHEITLSDLHNEINRLQQENRDLHFRMADIRPSSSSTNKQHKTETVPNLQQLANLSLNEPNLESIITESDEKRLQEVQRLHFEKQIDELQNRLIETEQKNEYLMRTIDELNKTSSVQTSQTSSSSAVPVLLPDPNISSDVNITTSIDDDNKTNKSEKTQMNDADYQHLLQVSYEKQRQQVLEIARLRAVLREILHAERLSSTSKILIRDCLASTHINDNSMARSTTPIDTLYNIGNQSQQRSVASSSTVGKNFSLRQSTSQNRPPEQRLILPPIQGSSLSLSQDPSGASGLLQSSLSQTNAGSQQQLLKFGETPIARRERRTQELQRTRLTRNLYH